MRCDHCEWRCELDGGRLGFCRSYIEKEGAVVERFPHAWSSCGTSRIESVPFYHVMPGSRTLVIGSAGCNFACKYCSNAFVARTDPAHLLGSMTLCGPRELVGAALKMGCRSIVFNVNEPTMSLPSLEEVAQEARRAGLPMGCLTNAYTTEAATERLAGIFSFFNIGLKGLSDAFNREYIGIPSIAPVLRNIRRLAEKGHVEIATPVIQSVNDDDLDGIAAFIAGVDPEIPWHIFRLLPEHLMKGAGYPSIEAIDRALASARRQLPYIYFHNFVGSEWVDTLCPECGSLVVERFSLGCGGDMLRRVVGTAASCPECRHDIRMWAGEEGRPA
ncbi:MAG TPA: radical SAM protein [Holophaga sp.]|nr:radical SAM protein [Holophaga sp.]